MKRAIFSPAHLRVVAEMIRGIQEPDVRQIMANHFGQAFNRRSSTFDPGIWQQACGGTMSGPIRLDGDTPGIPAERTVAPRTDLLSATLILPAAAQQELTWGTGHMVAIGVFDYAAAGRIFKWLQGEIATARRKIHG